MERESTVMRRAFFVMLAAVFIFGIFFLVTFVEGQSDSLADDFIWQGNSSGIAQETEIPDCAATSNDKMQYDQTTNTWSCDSTAPGSSINTQEDDADTQAASELDYSTGLDRAFAAGEATISVDPSEFGADWIDAVTDLTSGIRSGLDTTLITGTAGSSGNCVEWNADGDVVDAGAACGVGGGSGDAIEVEDGDDAGTFTGIDTTARFDDSGDINFAHSDGGAGGPDSVTATVRADSVALGTDTTGNYAGSSSEAGAATTALALDANGANCSANNYPLGVDASGAVESCTADDDTPDDDSEVPDTLTIDNSSTVDPDALSCDVGDDNTISDDCMTSTYLTTEADPTLTDDAAVTIGDGSSGTTTMTFDGDAGTDGSLAWDTTSDLFSLNGGLTLSAFDCSGNTNGGALTADASGVVTCTDDDGGAGGGGDSVTVNSTGADTTANFLDGDIDWTLVDGGAGGPDDITGTVGCSGCVDDTDAADALTIDNSASGSITLEQGTAPANTTEGRIQWETDDDHIIVGDGVATAEFVPAEDVSGDATMTDAGALEVTEADALESDPTDCGANTFATTIAANGNLTCASIDISDDTNLTADDGLTLTDDDLDVTVVTAGGDADSATAQSDSGLEIVGNELTMLRGCADDQLLKWDETQDDWNCEADSTGAGGSAVVLDLADDDSNESADLNEIATTNDTNSIFTEPTADKLLIDAAQNWPSADTADALDANPTDCGANTFATTIAANGNLTCASVDVSDDTNLTAGDHITLTDDDLDVDAEVITDTKGIWIEDPTDADDLESIWTANGFSATITKIWCESDQTVELDLQVDDGTPADVNGADLTCDSTPAEDESMGGDATLADGERLDLAITSTSGTPTWVAIHWTFTKDD